MRAAAGGALLAISVAAAPARGHLQFPSFAGERTIELRLNEAPIRMRYRVAFGADRSVGERRSADRDRDGVVSAAEGNAALDARSAALIRALRVCKGRGLADVDCAELSAKQIELVEAEGWTPGPTGHLHFAWTFTLGESAENLGAIRIEDGFEPPGIEISEVRIVPPQGRELIAAGEGTSPQGVSRQFSWVEARRGGGPRVIAAAWPPPDRRWVTSAVVLMLVALGALLYWQTRRERASTIG